MITKKITSNQLRTLVKQIIKENSEFRDMDDSDVAADERFEIIGLYEDQLSELFDFNQLEGAYDEFIYTMKNETKKLAKSIVGKFSEKDRDYLTSALSAKFQYTPSTDDFKKEKYIEYLVDIAIKK
jgi:hypothetical protein